MILVLENEVDLEERYLVDEMTRYLPKSEVYDYAREGGQPDLSKVDGVVVGGSTAGVYEEDDHRWMKEQKRLIRQLVKRRVPTLGICFGHQIVNDALGGSVEYTGERRANLVRAELGDDPLFDGVSDTVPVLHSDRVTETGDGMEVVGRADYYDAFATRHRDAPVWTVQYHPEFTPDVKHLGNGWTDNNLSFEDSTATRTLENFYALAKRESRNSETELRGVASRTD
ncbi:MAG: type 1 glutamine amidotransferase [Halobacteriales archaeon]|nr:type 1 glutamine amidotransferase [Halobacteriales archaeon]